MFRRIFNVRRSIAVALDKLQGEFGIYYGVLLPTLFATEKYTVKNNCVQNPLLYKISISKGFRFSLFTKPFTCISYITKGFVETL